MPNDDSQGLRVVLTPVQLAAVLGGASISEPEGWSRRLWNRVGGGLETLAGGIELVGSAALLLAPEPTMLTKVGGVALAVHGSDTTAAGMQTLWTGRSHATMTSQAVAAAARSMGVSNDNAERAGIVVDILVPILVTGAIGAARATAIRSGRLVLGAEDAEEASRATSRWTPAERSRYVNLDDEKALGGHTIERHVDVKEPELRSRLASDPAIKGASSFRSLEEAEKFISRGLIQNGDAIRSWASKAKIGSTRPFEFEAGEIVGYGVPRATNMLQNMTKLRFVLRKFAAGDKVYFLLTAHPIP